MKTCWRVLVAFAAPALTLALAPAVFAQSGNGQGSRNQNGGQSQPGQRGQNSQGSGQNQGYSQNQGSRQSQGFGQGQGQQFGQGQQHGQGQDFSQGQGQGSGQDASGQHGRSQQIKGKIVNTKQVEFRDTGKDILVALVDTDQGRVIVDLGLADDLKDLDVDINRGDPISARGEFQQIGRHTVLIANHVRANGQALTIDRSWVTGQRQLQRETSAERGQLAGQSGQGHVQNQGQASQGQRGSDQGADFNGQGQGRGQDQQAQSQQVSGQVLRTKQVEIHNSDQDVLVALVDTDQGRIVVDLGRPRDLKDQDITVMRGDHIRANGHFEQVGDYRVLMADRVRADGRTMNIDRNWITGSRQLGREAKSVHDQNSNRQGHAFNQDQGSSQQGDTSGQSSGRKSRFSDQGQNSGQGKGSGGTGQNQNDDR